MAQWNESLAQIWALTMSAAYTDKPSSCLNSFSDKNACYVMGEFAWDKYYIYTGVCEEYKAILIGFRGSVNPEEIAEEAYYPNGIRNEFFYLKNKPRYKDYQIWVTGHSLGGAFTSLIATYLAKFYVEPEKIWMITFGQPRVGDKVYAQLHESLITHSYRFTHGRDPVPHVPTMNMNYYHHGKEIYYKDSMGLGCKPIECTHGEDLVCSDQIEAQLEECINECVDSLYKCIITCLAKYSSIGDHRCYFGRNIGPYCIFCRSIRRYCNVTNCGCENKCPKGYTCFLKTGACYKVYPKPLTINDAKVRCNDDGGNIVSIHDDEENFFVSELVARSYGNLTICWNTFWIGLHNDSGNLTWDDDSPVDFKHKFLDGDEKLLDPEDCAYSHFGLKPHSYNGLWRSIKCENCQPNCPKMAVVCKIGV
uniref:C-type lectin domain-containing protein n=1 Tax=Acrobeloides nanus TaxID=290746 RepID=A0A914CJQ4_9BILA